MNKSINELVKEAHENAIAKGWWEEDRTFGELVVLMHSELSEAIEFFREGRKPDEMFYTGKVDGMEVESIIPFPGCIKPDGIPAEFADVVIRIFDAAGRYGIDLERAIAEKMAYNATRQIRHGGKAI